MKADVVSAAKAAFVAAQDQAVQGFGEACYDGGAVDQKASDGTLTQDDLDAAVKTATDPLNQTIADLQAKDAADISAGQDALAALQVSFDKMAADKSVEDGVISGLQSAKDALAAVLVSLSAIGAPVDPAPAA